MLIVIVTGLSGAGKSVALKAFEDIGFFCVDNLPTSLIGTFVDVCSRSGDITKIALGIDIRERDFLTNFEQVQRRLKQQYTVEVIFLEAEDAILMRRYKETRRPHPLGNMDLAQAIKKERLMLSGLREAADRIVDTSSLTPHQLRAYILEGYEEKTVGEELSITVICFGYKYGLPHDADLVFDVRFLPNPNFIEGLKQLNGRDAKVSRFVLAKKETKDFLTRLFSFLRFLIPLYQREGRTYLTIAIGCTGGKHRSPVIAEEVFKFLQKRGYKVNMVCREL